MSLSNFPAIGDIVLDPNEKFKDENQEDKYDLLLCDGSVVDGGLYPVLVNSLGENLLMIGGEYYGKTVVVDVGGLTPDLLDSDLRLEGLTRAELTVVGGVAYSTLTNTTEATLGLVFQPQDSEIAVCALTGASVGAPNYGDRVSVTYTGSLLRVNIMGSVTTSFDLIISATSEIGVGVKYRSGTIEVLANNGVEVVTGSASVSVPMTGFNFGRSARIGTTDTAMRSLVYSTADVDLTTFVAVQLNYSTPDMASPDPTCPYRIVADLT